MRRTIDVALFVKFDTRAIKNEARSFGTKVLDNDNKVVLEIEGAGRPMFDNVDYIHVEIPGDRDNIVDRPVQTCDAELVKTGAKLHQHCRARLDWAGKPLVEECDVHRFYDEFVAFKSGQEEQPNGTPLKGWAVIDRASVEELAHYKVYTVEGLAGMNDSVAGRFLSLREKAKDWLEDAKKGTATGKLRAELDQKDAAIKAMQEQLKELQAIVAAPKTMAKKESKQ